MESMECLPCTTCDYSKEFIDSVFAKEDVLCDSLADNVPKGQNKESHCLSIFESIAKCSQNSLPSSSVPNTTCVHPSKCEDGSPLASDLVFLAIPASALEIQGGLTQEQVMEGIAKMRLIIKQLTPENLNSFKAYFTQDDTSNAPEDAESVRFPIFENGRCSHKRCWKRLRAKRGYAYFVCLQCGVKWRSTSLSEKMRKQQQAFTEELLDTEK